MPQIELTEADVQNLIGALNSVQVRGEEQMITVIQLAQKLRRSLSAPKPIDPTPPEAPGA